MKRTLHTSVGLAAAALLLAGCATGAPSPASSGPPAAEEEGARVALGYEGGVMVLSGADLGTLDEFASEEFVRLNPAGDGRHVLVTTSEGFQFLDVREPELTDLLVPAAAAGHVVTHAGRTVLYDDATSDTTIFDTAELGAREGALPDATVIPGAAAHHGVSVVLEDGSLVTTVGTADGRTGIRLTDDHGHELAASADCPGVHGEGSAKDEALVFGCENGVLLVKGGEITKLASPDPYGRIGNAYVAEDSALVVMDYKDDPDAEGYLLHRIALVDTAAGTLETVDLPAGVEYTFRGIARGPAGEALLIGTDGSLHTIDPATGAVTASLPVIDAWEGPAQWQAPHPAVKVAGDRAYVTDPADGELVVVDLTAGEVVTTVTLPHVPNEIALVR